MKMTEQVENKDARGVERHVVSKHSNMEYERIQRVRGRGRGDGGKGERAQEVQRLQVPRPRRALEGAVVVAIAAAAAGANRSWHGSPSRRRRGLPTS